MDSQEFSFDVQHRPGVNNGNADSLSRHPYNLANSEQPALDNTPVCTTTVVPTQSLLEAQLADPALSKIIELKSQGFPRLPAFVWEHDFTLRTLWHCL